MNVVLVGLNHRTAPLALRQRFALGAAELPQALANTDVVISASGAPLPIIGKDELGPAMARRNGRSILLIDIAVPPRYRSCGPRDTWHAPV